MVKYWMILGDEAFDSESKAVGVIRLAPDEMDDWQSVAWGRFADVVNNNPIVRKMVFGCNYLYVGGSFNRKASISISDLHEFSLYFGKVLDNLEFGRTHIDYYAPNDTNMLILIFNNYNPEEEEARCLSKTMCLVGDTIVPLNMQCNQIRS